MDNLSGQTIRGYHFAEQVGSGGYGVVYRVLEEAVERYVAVKVIKSEHANQPEFIDKFENEARLVANLEHMNIVPLYTYWRDEHGAFLVMRYIKGGSLRDVLKHQGALSLAKTIRIVEQIAHALHISHEASVVHRDLKPDNILIDERGNAYLTDFGIAKQVDRDDSATGSIKGSFAYLSPEQIESRSVTPQTDIYALGVMLYEMLSGQHPFHDTPVTMMIMKHLSEPLPDLSLVRPDLPENLDRIIETATSKAPPERYDSVLHVIDALRALDELQAQALEVLPTAIDTSLPVRKKPQTPEERNRQTMIDGVRQFWIKGVLEKSLYNAVRIELGMSEYVGMVDNPWNTVLKLPDMPDESLPDETSILYVFDQLQGKVLILGDPGSGKTTTLLTLARDLLSRAEHDEAHPIPVVFNLSTWAENKKPLAQWLVDELNLKYQIPRKVGKEWIASDTVLPLLDGLDEVAANVRNECVTVINDYRSEHGFVDVVVCSRIVDYEALTNRLRLNGAIVIQPLQRDQVDSYLMQAGHGLDGVRQVLEDDEKLQQLTTSPLMLNILTLAYRGMELQEIPQFETLQGRRRHLFEAYTTRMLERRGSDGHHTPEQTKDYLIWLGKNMSREALSVFHIEHLQRDWVSNRWLRGVFTLIVTILEIPASAILAVIAAAFVGFVILFIFGLFMDGPMLIPLFISAVVAGLILLIYFMYIGAVFAIAFGYGTDSFLNRLWGVNNYLVRINRILLRERVRLTWSWDRIKQYSKMGFGVGLIVGLSLACLVNFTLVSQFQSGIISLTELVNTISGWLPITLIFALVGAIATVLVEGTIGSIEMTQINVRVTPNQGIYRTVRTALITTPLAGLLGGLLITYGIQFVRLQSIEFSFDIWLYATLFSSVFAFFIFGGAATFKHIILRLMLWLSGEAPYNMADFLDYASDRILLRKVGGGYIFIHRLLLEYFAELDDDNFNNEVNLPDTTDNDRYERLSDVNPDTDILNPKAQNDLGFSVNARDDE